jgi:hypothetical protein
MQKLKVPGLVEKRCLNNNEKRIAPLFGRDAILLPGKSFLYLTQPKNQFYHLNKKNRYEKTIFIYHPTIAIFFLQQRRRGGAE